MHEDPVVSLSSDYECKMLLPNSMGRSEFVPPTPSQYSIPNSLEQSSSSETNSQPRTLFISDIF
jgi:hypothetical protein